MPCVPFINSLYCNHLCICGMLAFLTTNYIVGNEVKEKFASSTAVTFPCQVPLCTEYVKMRPMIVIVKTWEFVFV